MKKTKWSRRKNLLVSAVVALQVGLLSAQIEFVKEYSLDFYPAEVYGDHAQNLDRDGTGYVIGGSVFQTVLSFPGDTTPIYDPVIATVDAHGTPASLSKKYHVVPPVGGYASFFRAGIRRIYEKSTSPCDGYLLYGKMDYATTPTQPRYGGLIKTDLAGNVIWTKKMSFINQLGSEVPFEICHVEQVSNGNMVVLGYYYETNANRQCAVMRINPVNGAVEWQRVLNALDGLDNDMIPRGMIEESPGVYYIYGDGKQQRTGFVLKVTDGWFVPSAFELCSFNCSGKTLPVGIEVDGDDLILAGKLRNTTSWDKSRVFAVRINKSLNAISDLAGNSNKATIYFGGENDPIDVMASDIHLQNEKIVLSVMINHVPLESIPVNLNLSSSGILLNQTRGDAEIFHNSAVSILGAPDSYVTGENLIAPVFRLTSRSLAGNTCIQENLNTNRVQLNATIALRQLEFYTPTFLQNNFQVEVEPYLFSVTTKCQDCDVSSAELDSITTNTGGNEFCEGDSIDLYAPTGFVSYQWFHDGEPIGVGNDTLRVGDGGTYFVMLVDENGCELEISIEVIEYERCTINFCFPHVSYCSLVPDSPVWIGWAEDPLENCNGEYDFSWTYNGSPVPSYYPVGDEATLFVGVGMYEVTVTTPCGVYVFSQFVTDHLEVYVNHISALPANTGVNLLAGTATFDMVYYSTDYDSYTWDILNIETLETWTLTTATPSTMEIPYDGDTLLVTLTLSDSGSCKQFRNTILWQNTAGFGLQGQNSTSGQPLQSTVYPNPADEKVTIQLENDKRTNVRMDVINTEGKVMWTAETDRSVFELNTEAFQDGIYFMRIATEDSIHEVHKLIVTH